MNFFEGVNQENAGSFEMGGDDLAPIPKDTQVLAVCEEAKNAEHQGDQYLNLKWRIHKPEQYQNRVIYQKVRVYEADQAKATKAKQMLFAIATNAGGKLFEAMQASNEQAPSDASLTRITNVPMVLKLGVWELDDKSKSGNWVQAVSPYSKGAGAAPANPMAAPQPVQQPAQQMASPAPSAASFDDEEIPF